MAPAAAAAIAPRATPRRLVVQLYRLLAGHCTAAVVGAVLTFCLQWLYTKVVKSRKLRDTYLWRRKVDFSVVQACVMTTEHLETLGRIEKRTLFVKPIAEVFQNEFVLDRVLEAAEKSVASGEPILVTRLSAEDRWHVLNTCTNHVSSLFGPYHVFFNEARRVESHYKSAWYCFTLTCAQTAAPGRWFITPFKPVGVDDIGMLRIRIMLMNEQELRDIASGCINPPSFGFLTGRHEARWKHCVRFAELFERQVHRVTAETDMDAVPEYTPEDNALLRIHIPFPSTRGPTPDAKGWEDCKSKDVVLYE